MRHDCPGRAGKGADAPAAAARSGKTRDRRAVGAVHGARRRACRHGERADGGRAGHGAGDVRQHTAVSGRGRICVSGRCVLYGSGGNHGAVHEVPKQGKKRDTEEEEK